MQQLEAATAAAAGDAPAASIGGDGEARFNFPHPGALDGVHSRSKPIMRMDSMSFAYPGCDQLILKDVTVRLTQVTAWSEAVAAFARNRREKGAGAPGSTAEAEDEFESCWRQILVGMGVANGGLRRRTLYAQCSRVAIVGANGAGKTTLLRLLVGELYPRNGHGEVWRHHALRVAYIAQHSRHHLETCVHQTPIEYIQQRYFLGDDKEIAISHGLMLTDEEQALRRERGQVDSLPTGVLALPTGVLAL
jgi:hypothetical protein